ncbi:mitogen-activated protein kinase kinase kinase, partial [Linderina pennispora]
MLPLVTTNPSHMREVMSPGSDVSSPNTAGSSSQSFATATSHLPLTHRIESSAPEMSVGGGAEASGQSPAQPESWTLMFVNKEFSATKKEPAETEELEAEPSSAGLAVGSFVSSDSGPVLLTQSQLVAATKAADQEGKEEVVARRSVVFDAEPIEGDGEEDSSDDASSFGGDLWDRSESEDDAADDRDKSTSEKEPKSKGKKERPQSNFKFTPGMRKALLERQPSRNLRDRPTADAIGEHLDRWFPDHDLDKPIIQAVPIDSGLLPSQELNIIVDDEAAGGSSSSSSNSKSSARQSLEMLVKNRQVSEVRGAAVGRRKSVRMLVQETRQRRRKSNLSTELAEHPLPLSHKSSLLSLVSTSEAASVNLGTNAESFLEEDSRSVYSLPQAIVRRKSTKMWGCIPEEVRPRRHRARQIAGVTSAAAAAAPEMPQHSSDTLVAASSSTVAAAAAANADESGAYEGETISPSSTTSTGNNASGQVNVEIVRRALSYLRKPAADPQAEKAIVEAAIKSGDHSAVGSTRAQFVHERDRLRGLPKATELWDALPEASSSLSSSSSVKDAVNSLFAKCGLPLTQIKIQWIKGQLIGKGSFGHVYVAINAATGEVIAVKQIALPKFLSPMSDESAAG